MKKTHEKNSARGTEADATHAPPSRPKYHENPLRYFGQSVIPRTEFIASFELLEQTFRFRLVKVNSMELRRIFLFNFKECVTT